MQNKFYLGVILSFCCQQVVWGGEQKKTGFAGMPGVWEDKQHDEVIVDIDSSPRAEGIGSIQNQVLEILVGRHEENNGFAKTRGLPDVVVKDLTESIFTLAHAVHDSNESKLVSDQRHANVARIDRCRAFGFNCVSTALGICGLAISIYSVAHK